MRVPSIFVSLSLMLAIYGRGEDAPPTAIPTDDERMSAAIAEARSRVDEFVAVVNSDDKERYRKLAVKAAFVDGEHTEYLWVSDLTYVDGHFVGTVINEPHMVKTVKRGQELKVPKVEIVDWIYADLKLRTKVGGFTDAALEEPAVELGEHELLGRWLIKSVDAGTGPREQPGTALEFTKGAVFMDAVGNKAKMADLAQIQVDADPKQIDFQREDTIGFGIYKVEGNTLTLSMRNPGQERPTSFKASPGGMVFRLEREHKQG